MPENITTTTTTTTTAATRRTRYTGADMRAELRAYGARPTRRPLHGDALRAEWDRLARLAGA